MPFTRESAELARLRSIAAAAVLSITLAGCMRPQETEDERLRRQTAQDTKQLREDARNAGALAREEALKARRQAQDIVAGVKQGWQEGARPEGASGTEERVNLNDASEGQLSDLPGVSQAQARKIVRGVDLRLTHRLTCVSHAQARKILRGRPTLRQTIWSGAGCSPGQSMTGWSGE